MSNTILTIITSILMLPGIAMAFLPSIPNIVYMFAIALAYGLIDRFVNLSHLGLGILAAIALLTLVLENISGLLGAKFGGAHWTSIITGLLGFIVGSAFIPIPIMGGIIGLTVAVLASEYYRTRNVRQAQRAAAASAVGSIVGSVIKVGGSVIFMTVFILLVVL